MLAGKSVRIEADEGFTVRTHQPPQPATTSATNGTDRPGSDQLAGIYVLVEAPEDLTVHPRAASANARQS
jgi:hypothetical protein